jgi:hypothetical protein
MIWEKHYFQLPFTEARMRAKEKFSRKLRAKHAYEAALEKRKMIFKSGGKFSLFSKLVANKAR